MLIIGTTSSSQNQQLPYTVFATDNKFSQTSWGTGTHDYTSYLNISAQTPTHT